MEGDACGGPIRRLMGSETCGTSLLAQTMQASSDPVITMPCRPTRPGYLFHSLTIPNIKSVRLDHRFCRASPSRLFEFRRPAVSDTLYSRSVRLGHGLFGTGGAQGRILLLSVLETKLGLGLERVAQQRLAPVHPHVPAALAQRPQHLVVEGLDPVRTTGLALGGNDVDLLGDLFAVQLQWQIVDVGSEGILDLYAYEEKAEDDVACSNCCWDGHPPQRRVQLEREQEAVYKGNLRDGDGVGDWKGCREDTLGTGQDIIQRLKVVVCMSSYLLDPPNYLKQMGQYKAGMMLTYKQGFAAWEY